MNHKITYFHQQGQRSYQQDAYFIDPELRFIVVCDGVGGEAYGELASRTVVEALRNHIGQTGMPVDENQARELMKYVWLDFIQVYHKRPETNGMGTTIVTAFLLDEGILVGHIGDSRAYHVRSREGLLWRTKDHSEVQALFDDGILTSVEVMERHPRRNVITRAFIARENTEFPQLDFHLITDIRDRDILMLCTDGVLEPFSRDSQVDILLNSGLSLNKKTEMIRKKCEEESKDNNTAVMIEFVKGN